MSPAARCPQSRSPVTSLTLSSARWVFDRVREGDPIVTKGTGRQTESWNGPGGVWNVPWATRVAGSALR